MLQLLRPCEADHSQQQLLAMTKPGRVRYYGRDFYGYIIGMVEMRVCNSTLFQKVARDLTGKSIGSHEGKNFKVLGFTLLYPIWSMEKPP